MCRDKGIADTRRVTLVWVPHGSGSRDSFSSRLRTPPPTVTLHVVLCCAAPPAAPADRACGELSKLSSLRELNLSQNRALSDGGLRQLARGLSDCLSNINLSYTSVTDESVATLANMKVGAVPGLVREAWGGVAE